MIVAFLFGLGTGIGLSICVVGIYLRLQFNGDQPGQGK